MHTLSSAHEGRCEIDHGDDREQSARCLCWSDENVKTGFKLTRYGRSMSNTNRKSVLIKYPDGDEVTHLVQFLNDTTILDKNKDSVNSRLADRAGKNNARQRLQLTGIREVNSRQVFDEVPNIDPNAHQIRFNLHERENWQYVHRR